MPEYIISVSIGSGELKTMYKIVRPTFYNIKWGFSGSLLHGCYPGTF